MHFTVKLVSFSLDMPQKEGTLEKGNMIFLVAPKSYQKFFLKDNNNFFYLFSAKIKKKMLYSSSFDALKKCLVGVQKYIQVMNGISKTF